MLIPLWKLKNSASRVNLLLGLVEKNQQNYYFNLFFILFMEIYILEAEKHIFKWPFLLGDGKEKKNWIKKEMG